MGTRHKHADAIIAWANGEEIEYWSESMEKWFAHTGPDTPAFRNFSDWRIKPKRVKKEGWVNIYSEKPMRGIYIDRRTTSLIYLNEEAADEQGAADRIACIRIEWEEDA